jgi:mono/diheme cytochrome c family protein
MRQVAQIIVGTLLPGVCFLALVVGCTPQPLPQFTPSGDLSALPKDAADDAERKELQDLQQKIEKELAARCGTPTAPIVFGDPKANRKTLERGAQVFALRCQPCHGVNGDGQGPVSMYLHPAPRDYTKGIFKFTSTPYGSKPRHADLLRTLKQGVRGTSMPSFDELDPADLAAVTDYVINLSQRGEFEQQLVALAKDEGELSDDAIKAAADTVSTKWKESQSQNVMPLTPMPAMTPETIAKGHDLYIQQVCNKCHGLDGRGGLAGGIDIGKDSWGHEAAAADLTSGMYRGGGRPIDIYRRIYSGINGTPMPGFSQVFKDNPENIWYLVHYVRELGERRRRNIAPPPAPTGATDPHAASPPPTAPPAPATAEKAAEPAASATPPEGAAPAPEATKSDAPAPPAAEPATPPADTSAAPPEQPPAEPPTTDKPASESK